MNALTQNLLSVIDNLPRGAITIVPEVSLETYESLVDALHNRSNIRLTYDKGRLQIVLLSEKHEQMAELLPHLLNALAAEFEYEYRSLHSCVLKKSSLRMGIQPDECYYFKEAQSIDRSQILDLERSPAPELALKIDADLPTLDKLPIYASLGIRELWQLSGNHFQFYLLENGSYFILEHSDLFHFLTPDELSEYISVGQIEGASSMVKLIQSRARK